MPSLFKNAVSLLAMQGVNYIFPLITLPYLTRALGVHEYGVLSTALTFAMYVVMVIDFGFNLSATRDIVRVNVQNDKSAIQSIFINVLFAKALLLVVAVGITFAILLSVPQYELLVWPFLCLVPQFIGAVLFPIWFFQGVERVYLISILTASAKLLSLPLLFILVKSPEDINTAALVSGAPMFFAGLIGVFLSLRYGIAKGILKHLGISKMVGLVRGSAVLFMGTVSITIYTACTPIILSLVSNYEQVAYFSAADKLRGAMLGIFLVLGQVIYPRANALAETDMQAYWQFIKKLLMYTALCGLLGSVFFYFVIPMISGPFLGDQFDNLDTLLQLMAPIIFLIPLAIVLSNCVLLPMGHNKLFAITPFVTALIHLPYAFYLSGQYGAEGASLAILITEVLSLALLAVICMKHGFLEKVVRA